MREKLEWLTEMSVCEKVDLFVLKPLDLMSSAWLVYIMFVESSSRERKELTLEQHRPDLRVVSEVRVHVECVGRRGKFLCLWKSGFVDLLSGLHGL